MADDFSLTLPPLPSPTIDELEEAAISSGLTLDPEDAEARLAAREEIFKEVVTPKPPPSPNPVSPAPNENFSLEDLKLQYALPNLFTTFEQQFHAVAAYTAGSALNPAFTTSKSDAGREAYSESVLPGLLGDAAKEIAKNVGITVVLSIIGYKLAGLPGALAGALAWIGPNIPAALEAKRMTEKALGA